MTYGTSASYCPTSSMQPFNPRHACAARVTVIVLCDCLSMANLAVQAMGGLSVIQAVSEQDLEK